MAAVRRAYVYIVAGLGVQVVAWTLVSLTGRVLVAVTGAGTALSPETIAYRLALLIVVLPLYLAHWRRAQHAAARDPAERASPIRSAFLYGTLALLLAPTLLALNGLVAAAWRTLLDLLDTGRPPLGSPEVAPERLVELGRVVVLGAWWAFHHRVAAEDRRAGAESALGTAIRQLYQLGFSAAGLLWTGGAVTELLQAALQGLSRAAGPAGPVLATSMAQLTIGLPLWLTFWRNARSLEPAGESRAGLLRDIYLYGAVLVGLLLTAASATALIAGAIRRLAGQPAAGDWREIVPVLVVGAAAWLYHRRVVDEVAGRLELRSQAEAVRRLYVYLAAAIGIACSGAGLGGVLGLVIERVLGSSRNLATTNQLPWSLALATVGSIIWWPHWRGAQRQAAAADQAGALARRALTRRIYLYWCLLAGTLAILGGAVYVLYLGILKLLGGQIPAAWPTNLSRALSALAAGAAGWAYTALVLREDAAASLADRLALEASWPTLVVDAGEGPAGRALLERLRRELPGLPVWLVTLAGGHAAGGPNATMTATGGSPELPGEATLASARGVPPGTGVGFSAESVRLVLITDSAVSHALRLTSAGPAAGRGPGHADEAELSWRRLLGSDLDSGQPIKRLIVATGEPGLELAGGQPGTDDPLSFTVSAVRQIIEGQPPGESRGLANLKTLLAIVGAAALSIVAAGILGALAGTWLRFR